MRLLALGLCAATAACGPSSPANPPAGADPTPTGASDAMASPREHDPPTFADDVAFLREHTEVQILEAPGGGRVALSAAYQGRVMTSAVEPRGASLGFVFRDFIAKGEVGTAFDNYGGEDRFWLGPEGGQFGLYFPPGEPFAFKSWQTPHALQEGAWAIEARGPHEVVFTHAMTVTNWSGTTFHVEVERTVRLLPVDQVTARVGALPAAVQWVAFESVNRITNAGESPWTKETGLLSVWILAMYNPSPDTHVAIPIDPAGEGEVNDAYFGEVPSERLQRRGSWVRFKCDGEHRSKIGIPPGLARPWAGSYSASAKLLTLVHYDKPAGAVDYVNSMWEQQREPYAGDVVNSYNDGPPEPGAEKLGGFYEIETSSPAAALAPGASLVHTHRTFHFVGEAEALSPLARRTLGVPVSEIASPR